MKTTEHPTAKREHVLDDPAHPMTWTKCFAVSGSESIIDLVHPVTGRSQCYGKTLADIRAERPEYALAEVVDFAAHCAAHSARQDVPGEWQKVTEEKFHDMLEVLPPAAGVPGCGAFMVGEACDHHAGTGRPRFSAFKRVGEVFFEYSRPMTFREFKAEFGDTARYCYAE